MRPLSPRMAEAHVRIALVQTRTVHVSRVLYIAETPVGGPRVMMYEHPTLLTSRLESEARTPLRRTTLQSTRPTHTPPEVPG